MLIFLLVLVFLLFLKFYFKQKPIWVKIGLKISTPHWWSDAAPPYWLADNIEVGDQEIGFFNQKVVEIEDVQVFETSGKEKNVYLTVNLLANYNSKNEKYTFKGQSVEIGGPLELHIDNVFVQGLVTFVSENTGDFQEVVVTGQVENKYPWEVENIKAGDKMKDGQGRTIAEVLDKQVVLADYLTTDYQGNVYLRKRPDRRDAEFKIKLRVKKQKGNLYFRYEQKVKIGENLFLQFKENDLDYLNIISIEK